jgi:aldehyde dehydrogenase (NAD+)
MKPWFDTSQVFIAGRWQAPPTGDTLPLMTRPRAARSAASRAVERPRISTPPSRRAIGAGRRWGALTAADRGRLLARLGTLVTEHAEALAEMEATDVGKPLTQARADVTALARYCEFYAGAADKVMGQTIPFQQGFTVYTLREPIGVTGHIVPWNYPMQIIGRSLGAALAMGNACVLKPAEEACLTALAFADLARQAGFPAGAINVVPGLGAEAGAALTAIPASAMSPSPARSPRAAWCRRRPRKTSFRSRWSWAASPRSWSSPTPISTRPCPSS